VNSACGRHWRVWGLGNVLVRLPAVVDGRVMVGQREKDEADPLHLFLGLTLILCSIIIIIN
jgi:hypothetical protein